MTRPTTALASNSKKIPKSGESGHRELRSLRSDASRLIPRITTNSHAKWAAQQIIIAFLHEESPRFLIRDPDGINCNYFKKRVEGMGTLTVAWYNPALFDSALAFWHGLSKEKNQLITRQKDAIAASQNTYEIIEAKVLDWFHRELSVTIDAVDYDAPLFELGVDSLGAASISAELEVEFEKKLNPNIVYELETIRELGDYMDTLPKRPARATTDKGSVDTTPSCAMPVDRHAAQRQRQDEA